MELNIFILYSAPDNMLYVFCVALYKNLIIIILSSHTKLQIFDHLKNKTAFHFSKLSH